MEYADRVGVTTEARGQGGRFAEAEFHEPIARRRLTPSRMPKSPRSMPDQEPTSATGGSVLSRRNWVRLIPALTGWMNLHQAGVAPDSASVPVYRTKLGLMYSRLPPSLRIEMI